jgi:hypothetical protein
MKEAIFIQLFAPLFSTKQLPRLSKTSPALQKETVFIPRQNREMPMKVRESRRVKSEKNKSLKFFRPLHSSALFYEHLLRKDVLYKFVKGIFP